MRIFAGTSGFSYPEWKGSFYPQKIKSADMLNYYGTKLRTVEINNTFYRMPKTSVIEAWASKVNDDFLFAVKTPRSITHFKKLADTSELLDYFARGLAAFGKNLGPILVQCPPTLQADHSLLREFLSTVDAVVARHFGHEIELRLAFEFRHKSWWGDDTYQLLAQKNACLVGGDLDDADKDPPLIRSARHCYLRLRKTNYEAAELESWATRLLSLGVEEAFVYFKHEEIGPQLAVTLRGLVESPR